MNYHAHALIWTLAVFLGGVMTEAIDTAWRILRGKHEL